MSKFLLAGTALAATHNLKLNNGVEMPQIAMGVWQYDNATAIDSLKLGFSVGFTHIDTAESYKNQVGVGKAIAGKPRDSYFLTTKTLPCASVGAAAGACYAQTKADFEGDLAQLGVDYVDLILLHGASTRGSSGKDHCDAQACAADNEQWRLYEDMYNAGKAKAIGVSNYCQSCFDCLNATVVPAVNQIQYHVGMGDDPSSLLSYCKDKGILVQAYSPLGNGKLVADKGLAAIGAKYNKSAAQVALKWIVDKGLALVTKADSVDYLSQDIDMYSWTLSAADNAALGASKVYPDSPSWACAK